MKLVALIVLMVAVFVTDVHGSELSQCYAVCDSAMEICKSMANGDWVSESRCGVNHGECLVRCNNAQSAKDSAPHFGL